LDRAMQRATAPSLQALAEALSVIAGDPDLWRSFVEDLVRVTIGLVPEPTELEFMVQALQARAPVNAGDCCCALCNPSPRFPSLPALLASPVRDVAALAAVAACRHASGAGSGRWSGCG
jgi:hypothetical protein